ncbi:hypothetical protein ACLB2K_037980 [Fragaria x ananassa]
MLAGVNAVTIHRLQEFPPASKLDPKVYGDHTSTITKEHIKNNLDGLTIHQALRDSRLFILDHHDHFMPYLRRINSTKNRIYGSRTLLFLKCDGTLKPLVIKLSLPHPDGDKFGCTSKVYTPAEHGVKSSIWQLAKAYVAVNDWISSTDQSLLWFIRVGFFLTKLAMHDVERLAEEFEEQLEHQRPAYDGGASRRICPRPMPSSRTKL